MKNNQNGELLYNSMNHPPIRRLVRGLYIVLILECGIIGILLVLSLFILDWELGIGRLPIIGIVGVLGSCFLLTQQLFRAIALSPLKILNIGIELPRTHWHILKNEKNIILFSDISKIFWNPNCDDVTVYLKNGKYFELGKKDMIGDADIFRSILSSKGVSICEEVYRPCKMP